MVEIYCGDGKGKTTAAMGLAVRAAGHRIPVRIVQFLKDGTSGELTILNKLDKIEIDTPHEFYGFVKNMTEEQKKAVADDYSAMLERAEAWLDNIMSGNEIAAVVIMDEVLHACNYKLLDNDRLVAFIDKYRDKAELVLTGRNPSEELIGIADYVSEIKKIKHPYDKGIFARVGIEL